MLILGCVFCLAMVYRYKLRKIVALGNNAVGSVTNEQVLTQQSEQKSTKSEGPLGSETNRHLVHESAHNDQKSSVKSPDTMQVKNSLPLLSRFQVKPNSTETCETIHQRPVLKELQTHNLSYTQSQRNLGILPKNLGNTEGQLTFPNQAETLQKKRTIIQRPDCVATQSNSNYQDAAAKNPQNFATTHRPVEQEMYPQPIRLQSAQQTSVMRLY